MSRRFLCDTQPSEAHALRLSPTTSITSEVYGLCVHRDLCASLVNRIERHVYCTAVSSERRTLCSEMPAPLINVVFASVPLGATSSIVTFHDTARLTYVPNIVCRYKLRVALPISSSSTQPSLQQLLVLRIHATLLSEPVFRKGRKRPLSINVSDSFPAFEQGSVRYLHDAFVDFPLDMPHPSVFRVRTRCRIFKGWRFVSGDLFGVYLNEVHVAWHCL